MGRKSYYPGDCESAERHYPIVTPPTDMSMTKKKKPLRLALAALALVALAACTVYESPTSETPVDGRASWMLEDVLLDRKPLEGIESPRIRADRNLWAAAELFLTGPDFWARFPEMRWPLSPEYQDATDHCYWYSLYNAETILFASGAGVHLMWGPSLRERHNAPAEVWDDPAKLYEAREERYRRLVGVEKPPYRNTYPIFVPFLSADPNYTQHIEPPIDTEVLPDDVSKNLWDPSLFDRTISPGSIGGAMYLECLLARHFFREWRPGAEGKPLLGASAREGWLGCHLVEMAVSQIAILQRDFFFDPLKNRMVALDAARHDPTKVVRFIPHMVKPQMTSVELTDGTGRAPRWQFLDPIDSRSALYDQAAILLGLAEFLKLTAPGSEFEKQGLFGEGPDALFPNALRALAENLAWAVFRNIEQMHFDPDHRVYVSYARNLTEYPGRVERGQFLRTIDGALLCIALSSFLDLVPEANKQGFWQVKHALDLQSRYLSELQYDDGAFAEMYDVTTGSTTKPQSWTLASQGFAVRGLVSAYRHTGNFELRRSCERTVACMMDMKLWNRDKKLFKSEQVLNEGSKMSLYTPITFAGAIAGLREWALILRDQAVPEKQVAPSQGVFSVARNYPPVVQRFQEFVSGFPGTGLLLSELGPTGEITFDSWDSDNDGIRKPQHAGGKFGMAPVFCEWAVVKLP